MSNDDLAEAQNTLRQFSETCSTAIDTLQKLSSSIAKSPSASPPPCAVLHKDYLSLLTLVYTSTTKLTLTLSRDEPAYRAALEPLRDLATNVSALTTCATLFGSYGLTIADEVRLSALEVCEALRAMTTTFSESGSDYFIRAGAIHNLIDRIKQELSTDNRTAVRKRWISDRGMLDDTLEELTNMIEEEQDEARQDHDDDDDDDGSDVSELDELGLGSTEKMSAVELGRTKKAQSLLRITNLLHKRVQRDILSDNTPVPLRVNYMKALDALPARSHDLLIASEEVVASLYAPQNSDDIASAIALLQTSVEQLKYTLVQGPFAESPHEAESDVNLLANGVAAMSVGERSAPTGGGNKDVRKWFDTCFEQIDKLSRSLGGMLPETNSHGT